MSPLPRRVAVALAAPLALGLALTACTGGDHRSEPEPSGPELRTDDSQDFAGQRYVAMGDSYTAAPGVEPVDGASGQCGRSEANYPRLVQGAFGGSELVDVSCSGATTNDLVAAQQLAGGSVPAQIDAVTADTDVVTISTGGNDFGAFALLAGDCDGGGCANLDIATVQQGLAEVEENLAGVIGTVRQRAPEARVLVIGYPQVAPSGDGCDDVPFDSQAVGLVRLLNRELANTQERAAEAAGAEFVDLWAATEGHALCSDEPWINGGDSEGAAPYHPLAAEQRAAAVAIVRVLDSVR
ncbi:MAG TPA: SGNH/GDSL hydrolase family protein [Nocardioides sp.]